MATGVGRDTTTLAIYLDIFLNQSNYCNHESWINTINNIDYMLNLLFTTSANVCHTQTQYRISTLTESQKDDH